MENLHKVGSFLILCKYTSSINKPHIECYYKMLKQVRGIERFVVSLLLLKQFFIIFWSINIPQYVFSSHFNF